MASVSPRRRHRTRIYTALRLSRECLIALPDVHRDLRLLRSHYEGALDAVVNAVARDLAGVVDGDDIRDLTSARRSEFVVRRIPARMPVPISIIL